MHWTLHGTDARPEFTNGRSDSRWRILSCLPRYLVYSASEAELRHVLCGRDRLLNRFLALLPAIMAALPYWGDGSDSSTLWDLRVFLSCRINLKLNGYMTLLCPQQEVRWELKRADERHWVLRLRREGVPPLPVIIPVCTPKADVASAHAGVNARHSLI